MPGRVPAGDLMTCRARHQRGDDASCESGAHPTFLRFACAGYACFLDLGRLGFCVLLCGCGGFLWVRLNRTLVLIF